MRTVLCDAPGTLTLIDRPRPRAGDGEVRLAVERVGICGTDYHIHAGRQPFLSYPRVMGHEISARVMEDGHGFAAGERVIVNPYIACTTCHACRIGKPNCCMAIRVLGVHTDGAMCEEIVLPARNLASAGALDADQVACVEFLAIGAHAVARSRIEKGSRALVIGAGPIGLGTALFARLSGASVTLMDLDAGRLAMMAERFGLAEHLPGGPLAAEAVKAATGGDGFETVFDATGHAGSMEQAIMHVAHGGSLVYVGLVRDNLSLPDPEVHKREMTIIRSRNALTADFVRVADALASGAIDHRAIITHRLALEEVPARLPVLAQARDGLIKAMISVS